MLKLIILLSTLAGVFGVKLPAATAVNGQVNNITEYSYTVSIQSYGYHICSGAIIRHNIIVTAAHCLYRRRPESLRVRAGSTEWHTGGVLKSVLTYRLHGNFNPITLDNDVGVIRLAEELVFSSEISSVRLSNALFEFGSVTGWGIDETNNIIASNMEAALVNYVSNCETEQFGYGSLIKDSMMCASHPGHGRCVTDDGAPLVYNRTEIFGIYSWAYGCGKSDYPGVYIILHYMRSWILHTADYI